MSATIVNYSASTNDPELPHICTSNAVRSATVVASTTETGRDVTTVKSPATYNGWRPSALPATVTATITAQSINYIALFGVFTGVTVTVAYSLNGTDFTDYGTQVMTSDGALIVLGDTVASVTHIRASFSVGTPTVYNMSAGLSFVPENGMISGFKPGALNFEHEYTNTESENGQILGRSVTKTGMTERIDIDVVTRSWINANWLMLRDLLKSEGVYFIWHPEIYPAECVYGMCSNSPSVSYSDQIYMSFSFTIAGPIL